MSSTAFCRYVLPFALLTACSPRILGQCDTTKLSVEAKEIEALTWSDYPKAKARAEELVAKYRQQAGWCQPRALIALGKVHWTNGDYPLALSLLSEADRAAKQFDDQEARARSAQIAANCYYFQGYYDSAEANFLRCQRLFVKLGHSTGQIEVLHDMALMYHRQGDFARSLRYLLELEALKEAQPNFVHYVGDFTGINNYFIDTLYYRNIIADEAKLLEKFRSEENQVGVYQSLINMSVALRELGEHRRSAYLAARGSEVMRVAGYYPFWYLAAKEYSLAGMKDSCFFFHRKALSELPRATRIKVATTFEQVGQSHLQFGQPDSALHYLSQALALSEIMNNRLSIASLRASMAKVHEQLGNMEEAELYLEQGLQLARQVSVKHTATLYAFGRDFYDRRGLASRALRFALRYQKLLDSINRNENAMELMRFQAQLETTRKERELEATRLKLRNQTIILVSVIVVASLSISFMIVFYFQRRRIKTQNLKLSENNIQQQALVQEIHHRVKNNLQYIVSLLNLQSQTVVNAELSQQIEEIRNRIMTMGVIHQRLYQVQGYERVDLAPFVRELVSNLVNTFPSHTPVTRHLTLEPVQLDVDTAVSIGLLINELITNAIKHAFSRHPAPELHLILKRESNGLSLVIRDNGPGFRYPSSSHGFGMKLIGLLVRKLKATLHQSDNNTLEIRIKLEADLERV
jgi:two-component sensor histidine kinase